MKTTFRAFALRVARRFGSEIVDVETGKLLGRALLICWRGKIHVVGLEVAIRPVFRPQQRLTYWRQELGFTVHPPPDFPNVRGNSAPDPPSAD